MKVKVKKEDLYKKYYLTDLFNSPNYVILEGEPVEDGTKIHNKDCSPSAIDCRCPTESISKPIEEIGLSDWNDPDKLTNGILMMGKLLGDKLNEVVRELNELRAHNKI